MRSRTAPRAARAHVPRLALPALTHQRCAAAVRCWGRTRGATCMRPHAWGFVILLTIARAKVAPVKRRAAISAR